MKLIWVLQRNFEARESKKGSSCGSRSDVFEYCYVYYNKQDACEAIEFFGEIKLTIDSKRILGEAYSRVKKIFKEKG